MPIEISYTQAPEPENLNTIIAQCACNDRGAQEKLYKMFQPKMLSMAIRYMNDRSMAEDVVNMGFLKCFQKIEKYTFQGSFEGWLRKIVLRTALDTLRSNERYNEKVIFVEKEQLIEKDHGDRMYYDQLVQLVNTLPKTTRLVFNLSVMEGMQHKEIAEELGISEGTSKWHLSEGRRILKEKIEKLNLHH
ncbi:MAG: sigma-70 family RNA polymerase sigma factor [Rubrivivax sp.]